MEGQDGSSPGHCIPSLGKDSKELKDSQGLGCSRDVSRRFRCLNKFNATQINDAFSKTGQRLIL
jgi:hypothetical protein